MTTLKRMPRFEYELRSFVLLLFAGTAGVFLAFSGGRPLLTLLGIIGYMVAKVQLDQLVLTLIDKDDL